MINSFCCSARAVRDAQPVETKFGTIYRLRVVNTVYMKNKNNDLFFDAVCFNKNIANGFSRIQKGDIVNLSGELVNNEYEKDGMKKMGLTLNVHSYDINRFQKKNDEPEEVIADINFSLDDDDLPA